VNDAEKRFGQLGIYGLACANPLAARIIAKERRAVLPEYP
jgi:hypothetical protein